MALYHYQAELGLVPQEVWFVGYILAHRWTADLPYPSLRRMSRRTGVSTQMLHRYKQSLVEKGYLSTIARHRPSGGRTSNYYDFTALFQALEQLLTRDRRGAAWQPSADESLDGDDNDGGDDRDDRGDHDSHHGGWTFDGAVGGGIELDTPSALPKSHQVRAVATVPPDQLPLSGDGQRRGTGALSGALTGPARSSLTALEQPDHPQEETPLVQNTSSESSKRADVSPAQVQNSEPTTGTKRRLRSEGTGETNEIVARWEMAKSVIAAELSPAAFSAWIAPLRPQLPARAWARDPAATDAARGTTSDEAPGGVVSTAGGPPAIRLVCDTAFQRQQVERRYLPLIERALGCAVSLEVDAAAAAQRTHTDAPSRSLAATRPVPGAPMVINDNVT